MPLKHLEHSGGEDFSKSFKDRKSFIEDEEKNRKVVDKDVVLEKAQEAWLSIDNELLWDNPDFDD